MIEVVGVLVAATDREHASAEHIDKAVHDPRRITPIREHPGQIGGQSETPLRHRQKHHAPIRGQAATIEGSGDSLGVKADGVKAENENGRIVSLVMAAWRSRLTKARQDLSRLDMDLLDLRNARVNQAIAEFRTTQARLDELKRRYATAETLLRESPASSAQLVSTGDQPRRSRISYTITRPSAGTAIDIAATETTFVQPGDTIRVELPSRDDVPTTTTADNDRVSAQPTTVAGAGSARGRQLGVDALLTAARPLRSEDWRSR
jgi:hypothetical protein